MEVLREIVPTARVIGAFVIQLAPTLMLSRAP